MQFSTARTRFFGAVTVVLICACAPADHSADAPDRSVRWVQTAAEFEALALQAYRAAHEDLDKFIADTSWSALPDQHDATALPPAIITDVDETVVSNVEFQATLEPPFRNSKLDAWNDANTAQAMPGAVDFFRRAQQAGVTVFFVTNRPCEKKAGVQATCPQEQVTIQDLAEAGIEVTADRLMLSNVQSLWDREKVVRRDEIAATHRVIMLFGDDLGDFIACSRRRPLAPCTEEATTSSRRDDVRKFADYWAEGWYILPNPMHGSWTSVE
jgi:acid phosphatase